MGSCPSVSAPPTPPLVGPALARFRAGAADGDDLRLLTKHLLALLVAKAPGGAVEVRVPPYAAAQCLTGTRHTRGTPPAAVRDGRRHLDRAGTGDLDWVEAERDGRLPPRASAPTSGRCCPCSPSTEPPGSSRDPRHAS